MSQDTWTSNWRVWLLAYAPIFLWLCVIFYLSSGGGSTAETSKIIRPLIQYFFPTADESSIQTVHAVVRKTAHITEYAILATLASRALLNSSVRLIRDKWPLWVLGIVTVTATIDEINQSFNSQRTGSPKDILLDISGGLLAVGVIWLIRKK